MNDAFDPQAPSLESLRQRVEWLKERISTAAKAVEDLHQDRIRLEAKIEDAQSRIQHILSRLPEQSDVRQLNLLGAADPAPTNPDDDHEPTTH